MNFEIFILQNINELLEVVLSGKIEHLPEAKAAKEILEDLIKYMKEELMEYMEKEEKRKDLLGRQSFKVIEK